MLAVSTDTLYVTLDGPDTGTLTAADVQITVLPAATVRAADPDGPSPLSTATWVAATSYDPATAVAGVPIGPGTTLGDLTGGVWHVYARGAAQPSWVVAAGQVYVSQA